MILELINAFNSGEWSPKLIERKDLEQYRSAAITLENALVNPYGAVMKRPGLEYFGDAKTDGVDFRLEEFEFDTDTTFILEMGNTYIRFWKSAGQVADPTTTTIPYEITTPWLTAELFEVQLTGINDVIFATHPNHPPQKITRVADDNWTIEDFLGEYPALLDANTDLSHTMTPSATTGTGTLTSSASYFTANMVGAKFEISHERDTSSTECLIDTNNLTSTAIRVIDDWEVQTFGTWGANIIVERSFDKTNYETVISFTGASDTNIQYSGTQPTLAWMRVRVSNWTAGTTSKVRLQAADPLHRGIVTITSYTSPTSVDYSVDEELGGTGATARWAEGAWSDERGHPRAVSFHEQRLWFGGTTNEPTKLWASRISDFDDFRRGVNDNDGLAIALAATKSSIIQWIAGLTDLLVGTSSSEWALSSTSDETITPTNVFARRQSQFGSDLKQPVVANEALVFVSRKKRNLIEYRYSFEQRGWVGYDLTLFAEHITEGDIRQIGYQQQYDPTIWVVTDDGKLASMTYMKTERVIAWSRHVTDGTFITVAAKYGGAGNSDEVWVGTERTIGTTATSFVERFDPAWRESQDNESVEDLFYLDCALFQTLGSAGTAVSGLSHLEGESVYCLSDGFVQGPFTVTGGAITLDTAATEILTGLQYTMYVEPMPIHLQFRNTSAGRRAKPHQVVLSVYKSFWAEAARSPSDAEDQWRKIDMRSALDPIETSVPLKTAEFEVSLPGGFDADARFTIRTSKPLPLTILAVIVKFDIHGN